VVNGARAKIIGTLFVSIGAIFGAACASVFGFEPLSVGADDASTGNDAQQPAMDAALDAGAPDAAAVCAHDQWPGRPDAASGGSIAFLSAVDVLDIGLGTDGGANEPVPGFDLDSYCTVTLGQNTCVATTSANDFQTYVDDFGGLSGGVDNATFGLIKFTTIVGQAFNTALVNDALIAGTYGVLVRIDAYNGLADDPDVFAEWIPTLGVEGALLPDGGPPTPAFDESDVWIRDAEFWNQVTYDTSTMIDQNAYVTGGKLVAHIDGLTMQLPIYATIVRLTLRDAVMTADIVTVPDPQSPDGGTTFRLTNGVFAGRWTTQQFLAGIRTLLVSGQRVCDDALEYAGAKITICPARDIASQQALDSTGAACDAVSVGIKFDTALAAQHKDYETLPDGGDPCATSGISPDDDCD
jgi:hypothetical protein